MILNPDLRHRRQLGLLDHEVQEAGVDVAGITLRARDGDRAAVGQGPGRLAGADHRRDAQLARNDRRMTGPTTPVGHDRRRPFHDRLPVRVGHVGDQHLAGPELDHVRHRGQYPDLTGTDLLPDGPALDQRLATLGPAGTVG